MITHLSPAFSRNGILDMNMEAGRVYGVQYPNHVSDQKRGLEMFLDCIRHKDLPCDDDIIFWLQMSEKLY